MRISVFGLGYVGSVSAVCLAEHGYSVLGVDIDTRKVDTLNKGQALIVEPELQELTHKHVQAGNLKATTDVNYAINNTDLSFICVGTPSQSNNNLDLQYIESVAKAIGVALKNKTATHIIAIRSTLFPGTSRNTVIPLLENYSNKTLNKDFYVCFNPEFMKEGSAVHDYKFPPKNVVGAENDIPFEALKSINDKITGQPSIRLDIEAAELVKYCDNVWHALKVTFANEIGTFCKALGLDSHKIMDVFCQDKILNISPYYLKPGLAFGGSCLPKDLRAFIYASKQHHLELPVINSVLTSNKLHIDNAFKLITRKAKQKIGILGFSFKENTDDLRESPMIELIERLLGKGYQLKIYDKNVNHAREKGVNQHYIAKYIPHLAVFMVDDLGKVIEHADTLVIGNKSPEFSDVLNYAGPKKTIIDLVRIKSTIPKQEFYEGICW